MTSTEALLEHIIENPTDLESRLVYADALEEAGETPRAEFIRTQMELSELGVPHKPPEKGFVKRCFSPLPNGLVELRLHLSPYEIETYQNASLVRLGILDNDGVHLKHRTFYVEKVKPLPQNTGGIGENLTYDTLINLRPEDRTLSRKREALLKTEKRLLKKYFDEWFGNDLKQGFHCNGVVQLDVSWEEHYSSYPRFKIQNGFVEEIYTLNLNAWIQSCGRIFTDWFPLTYVRFRLKTPSAWYPHSNDPNCWFWYRAENTDVKDFLPPTGPEHHVPRSIFDLLTGGHAAGAMVDGAPPFSSENIATYESADAAIKDLSRAALCYARSS